MTPTTGAATKDELYAVKQDLSKRLGDVEISLKQDIARVHERVDSVDARLEQMDERFMQVMAAFVPIYMALGIDTDQLPKL